MKEGQSEEREVVEQRLLPGRNQARDLSRVTRTPQLPPPIHGQSARHTNRKPDSLADGA